MCFEPRGQHAGVRAAQLTAGSWTDFAKPNEPAEGRTQLCVLVPGSTAGVSTSPHGKASEHGASLLDHRAGKLQTHPGASGVCCVSPVK